MSPQRKSCLKLASPMPSPGLSPAPCKRKAVVFSDGEDEVHACDDWDRTPSEPSTKLSYSDLLELKAIQRSLPIANQLPDPYSGKSAVNYLRKVPIGLLPLLPEDQTSSQSSSATPSRVPSPTPPPQHPPSWASDVQPITPVTMTRRPLVNPPSSASYYPPHLAHLRKPPTEQPKAKQLAIPLLPLLDNGSELNSNPSMEQQTSSSSSPSNLPPPPTATSSPKSSPSASLSPAPHAPSEPQGFFMPPGRQKDIRKDYERSRSFLGSSSHTTSPANMFSKPQQPPPDVLSARPPITRKKKNVMIINGIEIDLDDDDEDDDDELPTDESTTPSSYSDSSAPHTETESSDTEAEEDSATVVPKRLPRLSFSSQSSSSSYQSSIGEPPDHHHLHMQQSPRIVSPSSSPTASLRFRTLPEGGCSPAKPSSPTYERNGRGMIGGHVLQLA